MTPLVRAGDSGWKPLLSTETCGPVLRALISRCLSERVRVWNQSRTPVWNQSRTPCGTRVLDVLVSPVAAVSITFRSPLETLPLLFSVFAARFCNVLCCVVKMMFSYFAFCPLACVFLSCSALSSQGHRRRGTDFIYRSPVSILSSSENHKHVN